MSEKETLTEDQRAFVDVIRATSISAVETAFGVALDESELNETAKYPAYRAFAHALLDNSRGVVAAWDALGQEGQAVMKLAMTSVIDGHKAVLQQRMDQLEGLKRSGPEPPPAD